MYLSVVVALLVLLPISCSWTFLRGWAERHHKVRNHKAGVALHGQCGSFSNLEVVTHFGSSRIAVPAAEISRGRPAVLKPCRNYARLQKERGK